MSLFHRDAAVQQPASASPFSVMNLCYTAPRLAETTGRRLKREAF